MSAVAERSPLCHDAAGEEHSPLLLDITRLVWRTPRSGPSGIDRIELEYALHFLAAGARRPAYGVINVFGWLLAISPRGGRRFLSNLAGRWANAGHGEGHVPSVLSIYWQLTTSLWTVGPFLRAKLRRHKGIPTYLVVSHHHLSRQQTVPRIRRAFGVRCVCFLHDIIPVEFPEYFRAGWEERGKKLADNVARHFDAVLVNSEATAQSFRRHMATDLQLDPRAAPAIHVAAPGVRAINLVQPAIADAVPTPTSFAPPRTGVTARPYFVVLGTIEPRKNHLLLLNVWTRLSNFQQQPPLLHVIGARGWENEQVVDHLERARRLRGLVLEHNRLNDTAVARMLCGARALLLPSFVEGFGLPLAEALAAGVPVICSDIPAFREVGGVVPEYLDPLDHFAWKAAVLDYSRPDSQRRSAQLERLKGWQAPSWETHFAIVEQALQIPAPAGAC